MISKFRYTVRLFYGITIHWIKSYSNESAGNVQLIRNVINLNQRFWPNTCKIESTVFEINCSELSFASKSSIFFNLPLSRLTFDLSCFTVFSERCSCACTFGRALAFSSSDRSCPTISPAYRIGLMNIILNMEIMFVKKIYLLRCAFCEIASGVTTFSIFKICFVSGMSDRLDGCWFWPGLWLDRGLWSWQSWVTKSLAYEVASVMYWWDSR